MNRRVIVCGSRTWKVRRDDRGIVNRRPRPATTCPNHTATWLVLSCRRCMSVFWAQMYRLRALDARGELPR